MLDQLSDTDAALDSKLSAKPVNVASTARHPSQDDLESYHQRTISRNARRPSNRGLARYLEPKRPSTASRHSYSDADRSRPTGPARPTADHTSFALLAPLGETTPDPRPQFKWQPLAGAIGYKVVIVDTGLHPIQHSPPIRATTWRPRRPLARDRTYLWQVTATLHGGSQVVASTPTSSAAVLRIVPLK